MRRAMGLMSVVVGVLVTYGASQVAQAQGRVQPKVPEDKKADAPVQFVLVLDDQQRCDVVKYDGLASLRVHNHVRWDLLNLCGGRRKIELKNFRKLDPSATDCSGQSTPGVPGPGKLDVSFRDKGQIRVKLSDASEGRWCFDVHLDDSTGPIDPMIRIDR